MKDVPGRDTETSSGFQDFFESAADDVELDECDELSSFLKEPKHNEPFLKFWQRQESKWPNLAKLAMDYYTVQAGSVGVERAFSSAKHLITPERCSLDEKTIELMQFLKLNK